LEPWLVSTEIQQKKPFIPLTCSASGQVLDTSKFNYWLIFEPGTLPPVKAFWSVTMDGGKTRFLVENPLNHYLINSSMLPQFKKNADGESRCISSTNLQVPILNRTGFRRRTSLMGVVMRLYMTKPGSLSGAWKAPQISTSGPA